MAAEYAVYKGEELLTIGTAKECAAELNVKPETIKWYCAPSYQRRGKNRRIAIKLEDDE